MFSLISLPGSNCRPFGRFVKARASWYTMHGPGGIHRAYLILINVNGEVALHHDVKTQEHGYFCSHDV